MLIKVCELKVGLFIVLGITGKLGQLRALATSSIWEGSIYYIIFIIVRGWIRFNVGSGVDLSIRAGSDLKLYPNTD